MGLLHNAPIQPVRAREKTMFPDDYTLDMGDEQYLVHRNEDGSTSVEVFTWDNECGLWFHTATWDDADKGEDDMPVSMMLEVLQVGAS
jgi:hypothetical protein